MPETQENTIPLSISHLPREYNVELNRGSADELLFQNGLTPEQVSKLSIHVDFVSKNRLFQPDGNYYHPKKQVNIYPASYVRQYLKTEDEEQLNTQINTTLLHELKHAIDYHQDIKRLNILRALTSLSLMAFGQGIVYAIPWMNNSMLNSVNQALNIPGEIPYHMDPYLPLVAVATGTILMRTLSYTVDILEIRANNFASEHISDPKWSNIIEINPKNLASLGAKIEEV